MTENETSEAGHAKPKPGVAFAHIAFVVSLLPPLFLLGCMMLTHARVVTYDLGFKVLTLGWGPMMATIALGIAGLSFLISLFMAPKRCVPWALGAVAVSGSLLGAFAWYQNALRAYPPISDVATDWDRPLTISERLASARGREAKAVEDMPRIPRNESLAWGGKTIADINTLTCAGARPVLRKGLSEDQVVRVLEDEGYRVYGKGHWRVEGTYQDNFYGFESDIIVRIDPGRIDVRSISRYDMPDMGLNCRHVTRIIEALKALPDAADAGIAASAPPPEDAAGGTD